MIEASTPKMSTQAKLSQIKNTQNGQNSNQPLKFRSFDAFYQHYSKKQTYESSQRRNSIPQQPITNTTLKDKKESLKNDTNPTHLKSKPTFTLTTEDYNIKGRVKRLCEIFQKARKDINSRANLEKVITKNKITKTSKSPISSSSSSPSSCTNVVTYLEVNSARSKETTTNAVQKDTKHKNCVTQMLSTQTYLMNKNDNTINNNSLTESINNNNNNNTNFGINTLDELSNSKTEDSTFNTQLKQGQMLEETVKMEKNHSSDSLSTVSTLQSESFSGNNQVTTMDELTNMLVTHRISPNNNFYKTESEGSVESSRSDNDALIDDILNRFMNDPDFCDTFFSKLENLNIYNQSGAIQFSKVIDELLFLVENENSNEVSTKQISQDHKKDFEWFFNQPKVFNFNVTDRTELVNKSTNEQDENKNKNKNKNKFDMETSNLSSIVYSTNSTHEQIDKEVMSNISNDNIGNQHIDELSVNKSIDVSEPISLNTVVDVKCENICSNDINDNISNDVNNNVNNNDENNNNNNNPENDIDYNSVVQTNLIPMEYDLCNQVTDVSHECTSENPTSQDDTPMNFEVEDEFNQDLAKYFDWAKNNSN